MRKSIPGKTPCCKWTTDLGVVLAVVDVAVAVVGVVGARFAGLLCPHLAAALAANTRAAGPLALSPCQVVDDQAYALVL